MSIKLILVLAFSLSCIHFINAGLQIGEYYFSVPTVSDWFSANRYCTFHKMYLVDIPHYEEYQKLVNVIKQVKQNTTIGSVWTSGNRLWNQPVHYWSTTGQQMLFSDFPHGEPTYGAEQCILLWDGADYKFGDNLCTNMHAFVCRQRKIPSTMFTEENDTDQFARKTLDTIEDVDCALRIFNKPLH